MFSWLWLLGAVCSLLFLLSPFESISFRMATLSTEKNPKLRSNASISCYEACKKQLSKAVDFDEKSESAKALKEYAVVAERLRSLLRKGQGSMTREKWIDFQSQVSRTLGLVDERIDALSKSTNSLNVDKSVERHNFMGTQLRPGGNKAVNSNMSKHRISSCEKNESFQKTLERIQSEIVVSSPGIKWDHLVGLDSVKNIIHETIVLPSRRPDIFRGLRAPCRGLLLFGPPGNGKTLIAKAAATECQSCFFSISTSSLTSKFFGESESLVKGLFYLAKSRQPSFIFIDEVDSLLSVRNEGEHEASRRLKTEFLIQFDGLNSTGEDRIFVMAATNRPWDLDEAVRRRFTKRVYIPMPDETSRKAALLSLLTKGGIKSSLTAADVEQIVHLTKNFSYSDLAALTREAALCPIRELGPKIVKIEEKKIRSLRKNDFLEALKTIRPSICEEQLLKYIEWNERFGVTAK
ncbi:hypothetical protein GpartN1_g4076.t1 [Galdieria partita]|uniref:AAA+ ATPase domain-containing protein n=1 Tax=Galdieria partita TaxID=83374 RepID=A0A9C7PXI3_9RHOD|nr:hypothetical protein GpartN1_g3324.t1 [Galdieria partita]GJQ12285.1 hypothetical protein GpartN1_g4076.t1 [Galdieria partita]